MGFHQTCQSRCMNLFLHQKQLLDTKDALEYSKQLSWIDLSKSCWKKIPTERELRDASQRQGVLTMAEDAVVKVLQGVTSLAEVSEVVDLELDLEEFLHTSELQSVSGRADYESSGLAQRISSAAASDYQSNVAAALPPSDTSVVTELGLLTNYLKHLEEEQEVHPTKGLNNEIASVQATNFGATQGKNNVTDLFVQHDNRTTVKREVEMMMNDLMNLEQHQLTNPDAGIAAELRAIRDQIERLAK